MTEESTTSFKISMSSVVSNPMSDKDLFGKENFRLYKIISTLIIIDFLFNELIIINDCHFLSSLKDKDDEEDPLIPLFIVFTIIAIIVYGLLLLLLYLKKLLLSKITRFFYLIGGIMYFIYQITFKIINLAKDDFSLNTFEIILFVIISLTIIPKIVGFLYIKVFERTIIKIEGARIAEEHEMFIEKVVNKLDRSTTSNLKENELEKELDQTPEDDEEIILQMNNNKQIVYKKEDFKENENKMKNKINKKKLNEQDEEIEEEVADLS